MAGLDWTVYPGHCQSHQNFSQLLVSLRRLDYSLGKAVAGKSNYSIIGIPPAELRVEY